MRIMGALLVALIAIMGIAAATIDHVEIISPHNGDQFTLGSTIKIKSLVSSDGQTFGRMFINGAQVGTSKWTPTEAGVYTIMIEAADNKEFTNSVQKTVTVTVT